ncbi:transposase [Candidatus Desulfarcum epimagneticum]|uniref:Transposase n=1 Tax=uncultured Desulfobacteraceae bacterium TaxID=218296 RepID=A0A484HM05_9BACT|nr:transposase [uncultured Desulfobacteraceae bacterium]
MNIFIDFSGSYDIFVLKFSNHSFAKRRKKCQEKLKSHVATARILLCKICANLFKNLNKIIHSHDFLQKHRFSEKDFQRNRLLTFPTLIHYFLSLPKGSYQDELDRFYKTMLHLDGFERMVSKAALCKARKKLKHEAFIELNRLSNRFFYENMSPETWRGFNLLAIDGSTLALPHEKEITDHFGVLKPTKGKPRPMARISQMFDVINKTTIHAAISPLENGERELAADHFLNLLPQDLILLDRGYPAYWLFNLILSLNANFCARISKKWKIIQKFSKSGKKEKIIRLKAPSSSISQCKEMGLDIKPLKLRLIRVELKNGETEILITSLTDGQAFPVHIFKDLYHLRWPVEEDYKALKCRIEVQNFSGKSVLSVYQDFHSKVLSKNLTAMTAHPVKKQIRNKTRGRKHPYQINFTQALSKMKIAMVLLFNQPAKAVEKLISGIHHIFVETIEPIRPGRSFPRKHKIRPRAFYQNYKPIA